MSPDNTAGYRFSQATLCAACEDRTKPRDLVVCKTCWARVPANLVQEWQQSRGQRNTRRDVARRILKHLRQERAA